MGRTQAQICEQLGAIRKDFMVYEQCYRTLLDAADTLFQAYQDRHITIKQYDAFMERLESMKTWMHASGLTLVGVQALSKQANDLRCEVVAFDLAAQTVERERGR